MTTQRLRIGTVSLRAADDLILGSLLLFSLLSVLFFKRVESWWILFLKNIAVGILYVLINRLSDHVAGKFWKFFLRMATVVLAYAYLFGAVDKLQMIFYDHWFDDDILAFEQRLFGVQVNVWLQQFYSAPLTEWMMFSYVVYIPLYPVLCGIIYARHGEHAMEDYFFTLGLTNILCDIGFILFPVASPMYHPIRNSFTVPLDGYFFTFLGESIRAHLHFAGGSIPSPHTAAATIMWVMAYRYHRVSFWILAPVVLTLYCSTFYCRYHYITDAFAGILTAFLALAAAPLLIKFWDLLVKKRSSLR
ncbi:MAG: phosphatase PAP2 family protein [Bacteroidota bacterium]